MLSRLSRARHLVAIACFAAALAGCTGSSSRDAIADGTGTSSSTGGAVDVTSDTTPVSIEHNDADITFANDMIAHHQQAVDMANDAIGRASASPELKVFATIITDTQGAEIKSMQRWLKAWGAPVTSDHHSGSSMGMMSDAEMSSLTASDDSSYEALWLQMMIRHHEGAVEMAKAIKKDGKNKEAKSLAQSVIANQTDQVKLMNQRLATQKTPA